MTLAGLSFHHMGLAVKQDADAVKMLRALGYAIGDEVYEPSFNIHARLCTAANQPTIEVVRPAETGKGPLDGIVGKYNELIYHTCYETRDLDGTLAQIEKLGLRCQPLGGRQKSLLLGGAYVSFYKIYGWGMIELMERL